MVQWKISFVACFLFLAVLSALITISSLRGYLKAPIASVAHSHEPVETLGGADTKLNGIDIASNVSREKRYVYLDLGANWGNTLQLHRDVENMTEHPGPWDVYSFELDPSIAFYLDKLVKFLNGGGPKPPLTVLPIGYTPDALRYAERYGCGSGSMDKKLACLADRFCKLCDALPIARNLTDADVIKARLGLAANPPSGRDRFTFIHGGAGAPGTVLFGPLQRPSCPKTLCRGHAILRDAEKAIPGAIPVPIIDLVSWLVTNFREEDHIFVKSDIEGAEHSLFGDFLRRDALKLIDTLAIECHPQGCPYKPLPCKCEKFLKQLREGSPQMRLLREGKKFSRKTYIGWDSSFTPNVFYPVDPRQTNA